MNYSCFLTILFTFFASILTMQNVLSQEASIGPVDVRHINVKKKNGPNQRIKSKMSGRTEGGAGTRDACIKNIPNLTHMSDDFFSIRHIVPSTEGHDLGGLISDETQTLWFYSPYRLNRNSPIEFSFMTKGGEILAIATLFSLQSQIEPGIIGLSIDQLDIKLDQNESYFWYATVYCDDPLRNNVPDHFGYAWVSRSSPEEWPETLFWYDELDEEMNKHSPQPIYFEGDRGQVKAKYVDTSNLSISNLEVCELLRTDFDFDCK